jgi:threonine dehydrogenase-like Zn-dependent dehydrogenase
MLAVRKTKAGPGLELCETALPDQPGPGEILIEVAATGICGSDLHVEQWAASYQRFMSDVLPVTLGHETAGRVIAVGAGVDTPRVGDRVVVNPAVGCGACSACLAGTVDDCRNRQAIGMVKDGAFARYFLAPAAYAYVLPANVSDELGALAEPLVTSAHALVVAGMKPGLRVIVFGPGPIGQGTAVLARHMGAADVVVVGHDDAVRFETLRRLGFDRLVDVAEPGSATKLAELAGEGFDIAIEASGAPPAVDQALGTLRAWGILAIPGMPEQPAKIDILRLVKNRLQIRGVSRQPHSAWVMVLDALAADPAAFAPMITHRLPLSRALEGFALCNRREASKVLLIPDAIA